MLEFLSNVGDIKASPTIRLKSPRPTLTSTRDKSLLGKVVCLCLELCASRCERVCLEKVSLLVCHPVCLHVLLLLPRLVYMGCPGWFTTCTRATARPVGGGKGPLTLAWTAKEAIGRLLFALWVCVGEFVEAEGVGRCGGAVERFYTMSISNGTN